MDGGTTYKEQHRFRCSGGTCPVVTIPILNNSYIFSTGTSAGNITAIGTLNIEPEAQVIILGNSVDLPFTSSSFDSTGFTSITVTVGQGNPQNLTGISLQRFESGSFVEKVHLNCDGGAECPLQSMNLIGGNYQVVVEGSGSDALVGSILRP
ncbi:hypothetical protein A2767_05360 [Candidatus Roizmanbacteria bacterium RIFCSPHIGHO2_01_FULL_35_10]|uniref:IPT/TIG domain-containing protein n=1 Tax=Candidatus Roizmanbacteria bacterium RIFCSPLOWO2_01_FULL_35_13 TaxID=1802055 RepID=A0A1F7IBI7_9BACT|nr:MAG: hypothetical protein A2767_05360 [Candidatus Roizmanbacteria bacterium RIFCSPHIGHO2_01_FULL_35_10]OGK40719.1 MAG: hypothetical protein A3A74_03830 [Candidatus Roizmanbacteria bacterium RIFCSPLOWO2_01_FULL_35_13]